MTGFKLSLRLHGVRELRQALKEARAGLIAAFAAAGYREWLALDLLANSGPFIPVDTGDMRASHYVAPPAVQSRWRTEMGYGVDYAIFVHERRELRHEVGKAGWLLDALDDSSRGMARRLAAFTWLYFLKDTSVDGVPAGAPVEPQVTGVGRAR